MSDETFRQGAILTNPPRAVRVRVPDDETAPHTAVVANITVLTDSRLETDAVLKHWETIVSAINTAVAEAISAEKSVDPPEPDPAP